MKCILISPLLLAISCMAIGAGRTREKAGFSLPCFFLGAGFMLVETKGITELALVYGSTWMVVSVVLTSIMILGFLANVAVMRVRSMQAGAVRYAGAAAIILLLLFGLYAGRATPIGVSSETWRLLFTAILMAPLFFSGMLFSIELARQTSISRALSANLFGAMLGGFLEYNAMYFGYNSLYLVAIVAYLLAAVTGAGGQRAGKDALASRPAWEQPPMARATPMA